MSALASISRENIMEPSSSNALHLDAKAPVAQILGRLAQLQLDWDDDWCGTPPKHFPPKKRQFEGLEEVFDASLRLTPALQAAQRQLGVALQLFRAGQQLQGLKGPIGETGNAMTRSAISYFGDGYCGSVPLSVLIQLLLKHPPPPPPDWLSDTLFEVAQIRLAAQMEGGAGEALQRAGVKSISQRFGY
jgi:hypothetical protein